MWAIISRSLYKSYPIFNCGLYCRAVNITDNLSTKQGNSSIKSAVYNQERVLMAHIGSFNLLNLKPISHGPVHTQKEIRI